MSKDRDILEFVKKYGVTVLNGKYVFPAFSLIILEQPGSYKLIHDGDTVPPDLFDYLLTKANIEVIEEEIPESDVEFGGGEYNLSNEELEPAYEEINNIPNHVIDFIVQNGVIVKGLYILPEFIGVIKGDKLLPLDGDPPTDLQYFLDTNRDNIIGGLGVRGDNADNKSAANEA